MNKMILKQPKELTNWYSAITHRKGWVKWATPYKVCLCFSATDRLKTKTYELEDFLRLYHSQAEELSMVQPKHK